MAKKDQSVDYATLSSRLDEVVAAMQSPDITVDEAIAQYKEGMELVAHIETYLKDAEHKISKVKAEA